MVVNEHAEVVLEHGVEICVLEQVSLAEVHHQSADGLKLALLFGVSELF